MARYLCTVWPFAGHLNPTLAVAHALRARGHEVAFYSGEAVRAVVEAEGFTFFPFESLAARLQELVDGVRVGRAGCDDDAFYWRLVTHYGRAYDRNGVARAHLLRIMSRDWILGTVPQQIADLEPIVKRWRPDAMLCDPTLWGPYLVLNDLLGVPVAVFSFFAGCMVPGPDAPPAGLGLPSPRTWHARTKAKLVTLTMDVLAADIRRAASLTRQRYGLAALTEPVASFSGRMPLYLVATTPEFDYERRDLPPSAHYVGACLWDRPHQEAPPAWLQELPDDQPVIYVTEGTLNMRDAVLLRAAICGLADLPLRVIVTTGRHRDPSDLGLTAMASNTRVERFVPHSVLFPRLSAVVTTGGSGTVRAALAAGLPLVVVPTGWDQFDNAQRVVESGAGVRLSARRCTPALLRAAVQRVLAEPSFRANARRLGASSAYYGGPARAAELLERLVPQPELALAGPVAGEEPPPWQ